MADRKLRLAALIGFVALALGSTASTEAAQQPSKTQLAVRALMKHLDRGGNPLISLRIPNDPSRPRITRSGYVRVNDGRSYFAARCKRLTDIMFKCAWTVHVSSLADYGGKARVTLYKHGVDVVLSGSVCLDHDPGGYVSVCEQAPALPNG
jgi:hypothetical protein